MSWYHSDDVYSISLDHPSSRIFWPVSGERPFDTCHACRKGLMESQQPYLIERAFRGDEAVFEYGMCWACREKYGRALSPISLQRITAHLEEHVDFEARGSRLLEHGQHDVAPWLRQCLLTKRDRREFQDYQITAMAYEDRLLLGVMPIMLSSGGAERLQRLLSRPSRETLDDFAEQVLGMPPEYRNSPSDFML